MIARNPEAQAVEIHCRCGAFRWAPIENGDTGERSIDELEAEAASLWDTAQSPGRNLSVPDDCLIVFIDETGHEALAPGHYVYGLGGCAILARDLDAAVRNPWRQVRLEVGGSVETRLHAADMREPKDDQIKVITEFFEFGTFARIAATITTATVLHEDLPNVDLLVKTLINRIKEVAQWQPLSSILLVFESSDRANHLIQKAARELRLEIDGVPAPVDVVFMAKSAGECGLEVADFLIHTAGNQARRKLERGGVRKDYEAMFQSVDVRLVSRFDIDAVTKNAAISDVGADLT